MRAFFKSRSLSAGVLFLFLFFVSGDVVPQGDPGGKNFADLLEQGKKLFAEKDYENAIIRLMQAHVLAKSDPEKADVYLILSQAYFESDEREIARDYIRKMLELAPERAIEEKDVSKGYWKLFREARKTNEEASPQVVAGSYRTKIKKRRKLNKLELIGGFVALAGLVVVMMIISKKKKIKVEPDYDTRMMKIEWVTVPSGEFQMGDNFGDGNADERPVHTVSLDTYQISKFEITYEQFDLFYRESKRPITANPQETVRGTRPVLANYFNDAVDFCVWLSEKTGKKIHLPTEAQWEKAARGTDQRKYPWGNAEPNCGLANFNNCVSGTQTVGSYPAGASPYGVMDMAGNAMEWCQDGYSATYYEISPIANPTGPSTSQYTNTQWVIRGGGNKSSAFDIRAMRRFVSYSSGTNTGIGFRVCKE